MRKHIRPSRKERVTEQRMILQQQKEGFTEQRMILQQQKERFTEQRMILQHCLEGSKHLPERQNSPKKCPRRFLPAQIASQMPAG